MIGQHEDRPFHTANLFQPLYADTITQRHEHTGQQTQAIAQQQQHDVPLLERIVLSGREMIRAALYLK